LLVFGLISWVKHSFAAIAEVLKRLKNMKEEAKSFMPLIYITTSAVLSPPDGGGEKSSEVSNR
jgi:hypothetical protein